MDKNRIYPDLGIVAKVTEEVYRSIMLSKCFVAQIKTANDEDAMMMLRGFENTVMDVQDQYILAQRLVRIARSYIDWNVILKRIRES